MAVAAISLYAIWLAAVLPWAAVRASAVPQVVTVFMAARVIVALSIAFLLLSETRMATNWSVLLVGCAYLFSALMAAAHLVTFPGALIADRPLIGGGQLTSYVFDTWQTVFATCILVAAVLPEAPATISDTRWRHAVSFAVAATFIVVLAGFMTGLILGARLPPITVEGRFVGLNMIMTWAATAIGAASLIALWVRRGRVLFLWLMVVMATFSGELFLSTQAGGRFTVGWYAERVSGFVSGCVLFLFSSYGSSASSGWSSKFLTGCGSGPRISRPRFIGEPRPKRALSTRRRWRSLARSWSTRTD